MRFTCSSLISWFCYCCPMLRAPPPSAGYFDVIFWWSPFTCHCLTKLKKICASIIIINFIVAFAHRDLTSNRRLLISEQTVPLQLWVGRLLRGLSSSVPFYLFLQLVEVTRQSTRSVWSFSCCLRPPIDIILVLLFCWVYSDLCYQIVASTYTAWVILHSYPFCDIPCDARVTYDILCAVVVCLWDTSVAVPYGSCVTFLSSVSVWIAADITQPLSPAVGAFLMNRPTPCVTF